MVGHLKIVSCLPEYSTEKFNRDKVEQDTRSSAAPCQKILGSFSGASMQRHARLRKKLKSFLLNDIGDSTFLRNNPLLKRRGHITKTE